MQFFATHKNQYVYDAFTGRILECDELTKQVLQCYNKVKNLNVLSLFDPELQPQVTKRVENIEKLKKEEGLFQLSDSFNFKHEQTKLMDNLRHVVLELTNGCNLRCKYCTFTDSYPTLRKHGSDTMSLKTALDAIGLSLEHNPIDTENANMEIHIGFFGGEPFLKATLMRNIIDEAIRQFPNMPFKFNVTTNGTILTPEILKMLVEYRVRLWISLDGPKPIHDMNRVDNANHGTFDRVMKTLKTIKKYSRKYYEELVSFVCVISPPLNVEERAQFFANDAKLPSKFMIRVSPQILYGLSNAGRKRLSVVTQELENAWETYKAKVTSPMYTREAHRSRENQFWYQLFQQDIREILNRPVAVGEFDGTLFRHECLLHFNRFFVLANGDLYACIPSTYFDDNRYRIGSVSEGICEKRVAGILSDWNEFRISNCHMCWASRLCSLCFPLVPSEERGRLCDDVRLHKIKWMTRLAELKETRPNIIKTFITEDEKRITEIGDGA